VKKMEEEGKVGRNVSIFSLFMSPKRSGSPSRLCSVLVAPGAREDSRQKLSDPRSQSKCLLDEVTLPAVCSRASQRNPFFGSLWKRGRFIKCLSIVES
jgi:hypothetical protein